MLWYFVIHFVDGMELEKLMRDSGISEDIKGHIRACDMMYDQICGRREDDSSCACKKLLSMKFHFTEQTLSELCIKHCGRWREENSKKNRKDMMFFARMHSVG